jgi:hypothetical protein
VIWSDYIFIYIVYICRGRSSWPCPWCGVVRDSRVGALRARASWRRGIKQGRAVVLRRIARHLSPAWGAQSRRTHARRRRCARKITPPAPPAPASCPPYVLHRLPEIAATLFYGRRRCPARARGAAERPVRRAGGWRVAIGREGTHRRTPARCGMRGGTATRRTWTSTSCLTSYRCVSCWCTGWCDCCVCWCFSSLGD